MKQYIEKSVTVILLLLSINAFALSLSDDAIERGISETCSSYLDQIEQSYNLNGLNITFAHPENPTHFHHFIYLLKNITMDPQPFQQL
tara:strand:- start:113 stop:376 length:264 start_codon:yes stop_codon:yes gene_type:complete